MWHPTLVGATCQLPSLARGSISPSSNDGWVRLPRTESRHSEDDLQDRPQLSKMRTPIG